MAHNLSRLGPKKYAIFFLYNRGQCHAGTTAPVERGIKGQEGNKETIRGKRLKLAVRQSDQFTNRIMACYTSHLVRRNRRALIQYA